MDEEISKDLTSIQEEVKKLKSNLSESLKMNEKLRHSNERLQSKLDSSRSYAEELRLNVQKLSLELSRKNEKSSSDSSEEVGTNHRDSQTSEADLRKASLQWKCYHEDKNGTKWSICDTSEEKTSSSIADQVKEIASEVSHQQFLDSMAFEETSGLYYDYKTGYYYDADRRLYYDGHSGTYYQYNYETNEYEVHSRVPRGSSKKRKREKVEKKNDDGDSEEGEIESSDSSVSGEDQDGDEQDHEQEDSNKIPPCLRIIVQSSEVERVGTLYLVTVSGGRIGTSQGLEVPLEEPGCSKYQAKIEFKDSKYYLTDLGSRNGTYVNGKRVSPSKVESEPLEIGHNSSLQIGKTVLACHLHPGKETCFGCEPGLVQQPVKQDIVPKAQTEVNRRHAMKQIRKKYGLAADPYSTNSDPNKSEKYSDRAGKRRKEVGSDNPNEKTEIAHVDKSIPSGNKGFKMLAKLGWKEGEGLGKAEQGRIEPVKVELRAERSGLGVVGSNVPNLDLKAKEKQELWMKTQKRFENLPKDPPVS